jgi:hypothetical protein
MKSRHDRDGLLGLLSSIVRDNRKKSKDDHLTIFAELLRERGFEEYIDVALEFYFSMHYGSALTLVYPPTPGELAAWKAERRRADRAEDRAVDVVKAVITERLLELTTANGKALGDCNGKECRALGGFFAQIAKTLGADKVVRDNFSEAELQVIARRTLGDRVPPLPRHPEDRPSL